MHLSNAIASLYHRLAEQSCPSGTNCLLAKFKFQITLPKAVKGRTLISFLLGSTTSLCFLLEFTIEVKQSTIPSVNTALYNNYILF